jgi:hypothetical protein
MTTDRNKKRIEFSSLKILLTPPLFLDNYNAERIKLIEYDQKYPKEKRERNFE